MWNLTFPFKLLRSASLANKTYSTVNVLDLAQAAASLIRSDRAMECFQLCPLGMPQITAAFTFLPPNEPNKVLQMKGGLSARINGVIPN